MAKTHEQFETILVSLKTKKKNVRPMLEDLQEHYRETRAHISMSEVIRICIMEQWKKICK